MMKMPKTVLKTSVALVTLLSFVAPALAMPLEYRAIAAGAAGEAATQVQYQEGGYGRGYGGADDRDGQFRGGYGGADYGDRGYGGAGNDSREDRRGGYGGARQGWDDRRDWRQDRRDERRAERERERQREWARERERERERQWARERDRRDGYYNGHRGSRDRRPGYREHNGYWYPLAAFAVGAIIGGAVNGNNNRAQPAYGGSHHEWCANRWRSYRASDNSYQPSNGPRQACVSPYMR